MFEVAIFLYAAVYRRSPGYMLGQGLRCPSTNVSAVSHAHSPTS